jgi:hypothetical protein
LKFENVLHHMKIQHQKTKEHSLWPLHHWKTITFFRYPKHISVKFTVAVFIMDYGNSIFSWFNIRKLKTCIFPVICVIIVLDANFKIYQGNLRFKIAQAITPVLLLIFWFYIYGRAFYLSKTVWGQILNLEPAKIAVVKIFWKTEHFRVFVFRKKACKK